MTLSQVLDYINTSNTPDTQKEVGVFLSVSLHTKGVRPRFTINHQTFVPQKVDFLEDYQRLFDNYLLSRHPREAEITRNWRLSQYKPFTKTPFLQITDIIKGAIFQDGQYTIQLPNKADEDYIWSKKFEGFNLISFFENKILKLMLEDPNGYLVRMPNKPSYQTTGAVELALHYVCIKDVIQKPNTGDFIFYSRDRKFIYWINDKVIIRFVKTNQGKWVLENPNGYYAHLLGYIPADILGGQYETEGYYSSFLHKAVPVADEFIANYSAKQMVDKEASHPYIQQMTVQCSTCNGQGTVQHQCEISPTNPVGFELKQCSTCSGSGQISLNPADRFLVKAEDMDKVAVRIINPDISINNYHRENAKELMQNILDALHLTLINEAQSGSAKAIDQEKLYQFISGISNHLFDNLIYNTILDIIRYRNIKVNNGVALPHNYEFTFVKPQQFNIKTAMDLLSEITETQNANLPLFIRRKMINEFVDKRFSSDDVFAKKSKVVALLDPLFAYSIDEIAKLSTITNEQVHFSQHLPIILDKIEAEHTQNFILDNDIDTIKEKVMEMYEKLPKSVNNSLKKNDETA